MHGSTLQLMRADRNGRKGYAYVIIYSIFWSTKCNRYASAFSFRSIMENSSNSFLLIPGIFYLLRHVFYLVVQILLKCTAQRWCTRPGVGGLCDGRPPRSGRVDGLCDGRAGHRAFVRTKKLGAIFAE